MKPGVGTGAVLLALVVGGPLAASAQLTKDQQKCALVMASHLRTLAIARGKDVAACLGTASGGTLAGGLAACVGDDGPRKIAAAMGKATADFDTRCTGESKKPPGTPKRAPFGVSDATAINDAARSQAAGLVADLLGHDLDAAVIAKAADKNGASCQLALAKAITKCQDAQLGEFAGCLRTGVKSTSAPFDDAADVAACIGVDPKGRAAKRCNRSGAEVDALRKTLDERCIAKGIDPLVALPGCATSDPGSAHACVARAVACRTCLALAAGAAPGQDCDAVDDSLLNLSCPSLAGLANPFVVDVPPFTARVVADRASGVPGTVFHLHVDASVPIATATWSGPGGFTSQGPDAQVTLTQPGLNPVNVTVRDADGREVTTGIDLVVFDPADIPAPVLSSITPASGRAGALVRLTSPALLDPDAVFTVTIGGGPPIEPFRPTLGTANIAIPFSVAAGLSTPTPIAITLLEDGIAADDFEFVVSPAPALSGAAGDLTREVLAAVPPLLAQLRAALPQDVAAAGLANDELAVLLGTLDAAAFASRDLVAEALDLAGQLDPSALAAIDQALIANGLPPDFQAPAAAAVHGRAAGVVGEALLRGCCFFHDVNDGLQQAMGALRFAAPLVALAGLSGGPVSGPILVGFANAALQLGNVADLAKIVAKLVPRVADELVVTTSVSRIAPNSNEKAVIRVKGKLVFDIDICRDAIDKLFAELAKAAAAAVLPRVPLNTFLNEIWRRTAAAPAGRVGSVAGEVSAELSNFLAEVIDRLADGIVDLSGADGLLKSAQVKICDVYDDQEIPIRPTPDVVTLVDPSAGSLGPFTTDTVLFGCNPGVDDTVTIRAEYLCGFRTLRGEVDVTCGEETCAEDAAGSVETILRQVQLLDQGVEQCQGGPIGDYHVLTRTMGVKWKNTHPTRTIALSFVVKDTANSASYDTPPCVGSACDNAVGRCFTFLPPGATSSEVVYNCESTLDTPVVDGTNPCVSGPVEITAQIIAHATYCNFESSNKDLFCDDVSRHLLETETPHQSFFPIQRSCF